VVMKDGVNESSLKRSRQHDLPTPESPMRRSLICRQPVSWSATCLSGRSEDPRRGEARTHQKVVVSITRHGCDWHSELTSSERPGRGGTGWDALREMATRLPTQSGRSDPVQKKQVPEVAVGWLSYRVHRWWQSVVGRSVGLRERRGIKNIDASMAGAVPVGFGGGEPYS